MNILHLLSASAPFVFGTFNAVLQWVLHNGYPIIFIGMVIEGPTILAASAFATTLGYFNLGIIFLLGVAGDVVGDFIWYGLGYYGRLTVIKKFGHLFGATDERMEKLRQLLEKHPKKILFAIKLSPLLPVPGLIVTGSSHMSVKKFAGIITMIIVPKTILFMALGYFFGRIYDKISGYINNGLYLALAIVVLVIGIHYLYKWVMVKISKRLETDGE